MAICSVSLKNPSDPKIVTVYNQHFNPTLELDQEAQLIHGKSREMLANFGPFTKEAAEAILDCVRGSRGVICHNYRYDRQVLWQQFERVGAGSLASP